jgi:hypothetical protein
MLLLRQMVLQEAAITARKRTFDRVSDLYPGDADGLCRLFRVHASTRSALAIAIFSRNRLLVFWSCLEPL